MAEADRALGAPGPARPLAAAGLLILLLAAQYLLFRAYALREITWSYPDHFDQAVYLTQTYTLYEDMRAHGVWPALCGQLGAVRPQGVLFPVEGSLFLLALGPGRLSALTMHFAHFALFQAAFFATLWWRTRRPSVAWLGLGLLLTLAAPHTPGGGMFDYRIDFSAWCLFGVAVCAAVRSRLFASWPWSLVTGAAASWTVLCRSLTLAYLAGVAGLFAAFLLVRAWRGDGAFRRVVAHQLVGLLIAAAVLAALAGPVVGNNVRALYGYYVGSHFSGVEGQMRAEGSGVFTFLDGVTFYPQAVAREYFGLAFLVLAGLALAAALVLRLAAGRRAAAAEAPPPAPGTWFFLMACLLVPYALLTLDPAKLACVAGIFVPPLVWLTVLALAALCRTGRSPVLRAGPAVLAGAALVTGAGTQLALSRGHSWIGAQPVGYRKIADAYEVLGRYFQERHCTNPRIAATCVGADYFQPIVVLPYLYEKHHVLVRPQSGRMGGYLWAVTEAEVLDEVRRSDVVMLVDPTLVPSSPYPFDECLRELYPRLKAYCEEHLVPLHRLRLWRHDIAFYVRPADGAGEVAP